MAAEGSQEQPPSSGQIFTKPVTDMRASLSRNVRGGCLSFSDAASHVAGPRAARSRACSMFRPLYRLLSAVRNVCKRLFLSLTRRRKGSVLPVASDPPRPHPKLSTCSIAGIGDSAPRDARKQRHTERFLRRSKRFHATRSCFNPSIAQMEYSKSGVLRNEDFRRAVRSRTVDSVASTATCVSDDGTHQGPFKCDSDTQERGNVQ